jgi:retron-type reverse transcriptase
MYKRLHSFLTKHNILYDYQFGFRSNHSTILAVTEIVDNIREELDYSNHVLGLYLDLSKAFDCVNHDILLNKLSHYGIRGTTLDWFKSYLSSRTQKSFVNNTYSDAYRISTGVPQGSVLGPILFLIYVNDIAESVHNGKIRLFADDTNLFLSGKSFVNTERCQ